MNNVTYSSTNFTISQRLTTLVMWEAIVRSWSRKCMHLLHQTMQLAENLLLFWRCLCDRQPLSARSRLVSCQSHLGWL